jgi:hypothetical protein
MTNTKLTGVTRYRVQNRFLRSSVLVLQVEYTVKGFEHDSFCSTNDVDYIGWRDATVEDLTSLRIKHD